MQAIHFSIVTKIFTTSTTFKLGSKKVMLYSIHNIYNFISVVHNIKIKYLSIFMIFKNYKLLI